MEIDLTTSNSGWICSNVVLAMCELPNLKNVCFDSSRILLFITDQRFRQVLPHTCWGYMKINKKQLSLKGKYTQEDIDMWDHYVGQEELTVENIILNRLREFTLKCNFTDLCWIAETEEFMDPLLFHEYECDSGHFYDSDSDSDSISIFRDMNVPLMLDSSSDSSDSNDGFY